MFGYVRAVPAALSPEDRQRYEGLYCGLCRALGQRYGWTARMTLNYDFVFLALLLAPPEEEGTVCIRCPAKPWVKKTCWQAGEALALAADESIILTWWKLRDEIRDGGLFRRLVSRLACLPLRRHYRRASAFRPAFDALVQGCLEELHEMETQRLPSLDRPADTFARILQGAAAELEPAARGSAAGQILYHVGRWIYLTDAFDDLEEDQARGNYNPLLLRYGPQVQKEPEALRETLHVSLGLADTAYALLDWGAWESLLGHILRTGLPVVEEAVFSGTWKQRNKTRKDNTPPPALPGGEGG